MLYFVFRGREDRPEALNTAKRALGSGTITDHTVKCPYERCPVCAAAGDNMKQQWDGVRRVTWTCGYCGSVAGVQELTDAELPSAAPRSPGPDGQGW